MAVLAQSPPVPMLVMFVRFYIFRLLTKCAFKNCTFLCKMTVLWKIYSKVIVILDHCVVFMNINLAVQYIHKMLSAISSTQGKHLLASTI